MFWHPTPTSDLYFLNSCADQVTGGFGALFGPQKPVRRLGHNVFQTDGATLVIRQDQPALTAKVLQDKSRRLIYLIDDNIWQVEDDHSLSESYRQKLIDFREATAKPLIDASDHLIVSSTFLKQFVLGHDQVSLMRPTWAKECPQGQHFAYGHKLFNLVHMGTGSHQAGFDLIAPTIEKLITRYDHVTFTYHSNTPLLGALDAHPRVIRRMILRWPYYRRHIGKYPYHLALYPIVDTPLNQGRSINKLLEHPLSGCAGIYSKGWIHDHHVTDHQAGAIVPNDVDDWVAVISGLIENPDRAHQIYRQAVNSFKALNRLDHQRQFWLDHFINRS